MTTVGVISDTHGYFDPKVPGLFRGVDHILHAGDIGLPWIILELESIAPVTAVLGNTDEGLHYRETEIATVGDRKFLVHHIVEVGRPAPELKARIVNEGPDVVVFGHSHQRYCNREGNILYFNPGYAGKPRFALPRSVAVLRCDSEGIKPEYFEL
jgi:putative phosphoesterase